MYASGKCESRRVGVNGARGKWCSFVFAWMRLPLLLFGLSDFHLFTAGSAVNYDDLRPLIAVGITSSVLLAQHFGCSKRWINLEHGTLTANLLPAGWRVHS